VHHSYVLLLAVQVLQQVVIPLPISMGCKASVIVMPCKTCWEVHLFLGANIDATTTTSWNSGAGFVPIGQTSAAAFTGSFDGAGLQ